MILDGNEHKRMLLYIEKSNKSLFEHGELKCFFCKDWLDELLNYGVLTDSAFERTWHLNRKKFHDFCKMHDIEM